MNVTSACEESSWQSSTARSSIPSSRCTTSSGLDGLSGRLLESVPIAADSASRPKARWAAPTAAGPSVRAISTEILISLVVIMRTLIFSRESAENIFPATPSALAMPTPTTDIFAIEAS